MYKNKLTTNVFKFLKRNIVKSIGWACKVSLLSGKLVFKAHKQHTFAATTPHTSHDVAASPVGTLAPP